MTDKRARLSVHFSIKLTMLFVLVAIGFGGDCNWKTNNGNSGTGNGEPNKPEFKSNCCTDAPPPGYVRINDKWDPANCGGKPDVVFYNVCEYQRYDNKATGYTLRVCADAPLPPGWEGLPGTEWDPSVCGHPVDNNKIENVKTIKKS